MHKAITCSVQAGHLLWGQVVVNVHDFRGVGLGLGLLDDFGKGLPGVKSFSPEILDHQANIVVGCEGFEVCI